MFIAILVSLLVILWDQVVKWIIISHFKLYESAQGIPGVFDWFYIQNKGASWGFFENQFLLFYIVTIVAVVYLLYLLVTSPPKKWYTKVLYGLLIGGAIGNFIDRIRLGYVVDMIRLSFIDFPIFNVADMCLTIGIIGFIVIILFNKDNVGA